MNEKLLLLKKYYGYDSLRPLQEPIIDAVLTGKDLMVVMPTGGGKSLCFQLPSLMTPGLTLVISPLIALMKDQVDALRANGIPASYYNSSQELHEQQQVLAAIEEKSIKLLYTAPESIAGLLNHLKTTTLSLIAVDEAHCISTWGHDFRPAYTQLAHLKTSFPDTGIIALTATADRATRADIKKQLNIGHATDFVASFDRPNINLQVRPGIQRMERMRRFLKKRPGQAGIIYCLSRKSCESIAARLNNYGFNAAAYHAGMEHRFRESVQTKFLNDQIDIVCATIAFGMGIDKSNVRFVIHYNMPKNIEGYYQEIGRAGRDGLDSQAVLYHSYSDMIQLRKFAESGGNSEVQIAKLERMKQFAEALTCRRRMLLSYFNEYLEEDCGNCDVCENKPQLIDATLIAQKALSAVYRMKGMASMNLLIDILRGASNAGVVESGFAGIKTYGAGRDISWKDWQQYIIQLINHGILEIAFHDHNRLRLTPQAQAVLFENKEVQLAMPIEHMEAKKDLVDKPSTLIIDQEVLMGLKDVRKHIAKEYNLAPFMVFSDASLQDMAQRIPLTMEEFLDITGVGEHKQQQYGEVFLTKLQTFYSRRDGVFSYRSSNSVKNSRTKKPKRVKGDTILETVNLFKSGLDVASIAQARKMKETTILSHMAQRYSTDQDLEILPLLSGIDLKAVARLLPGYLKEQSIKQVYDYFDGTMEYGVLRLALAYVEAEALKISQDV
ncbi:MAG: DNA helicase RecQ [Nonlabens sp.]